MIVYTSLQYTKEGRRQLRLIEIYRAYEEDSIAASKHWASLLGSCEGGGYYNRQTFLLETPSLTRLCLTYDLPSANLIRSVAFYLMI